MLVEILRWYGIIIISLMLFSFVANKSAKASTVIVSGVMFIPILVYLVIGGVS